MSGARTGRAIGFSRCLGGETLYTGSVNVKLNEVNCAIATRREFILISHSDFGKPTRAQLIKDGSFIESVKRDLVPALVDDLEAMYPGYTDMKVYHRMARLLEANAEYQGKGDFLPVRFEDLGFYAFAGVELGHRTEYLGGNMLITYYKPLFSYFSPRPLPDDIVAFTGAVRESDLRHYLYRAPGTPVQPGEPLFWGDIPDYRNLPIAYRVALVCQYVNEHVVAHPDDVTAFVLGAADELPIHRYLVSPTKDADGLNSGWCVRIRDLRPSQEFGRHIADHLKGLVEASEDFEQDSFRHIRRTAKDPSAYRLESQFEGKPKGKRRASPESTLTMVAFVDDLIARQGRPGRGNDLSWEDAAGLLASETGLTYTGNNLRNAYNTYKKRHGQAEGR